jgi:hypothetical protein
MVRPEWHNSEGTIDPSFDPGTSYTDDHSCCGQTITVVAVLPDGKVLAGGDFAWFDQVPRLGLVRLHGDPPLRFATVVAASGACLKSDYTNLTSFLEPTVI